ncbi:NAD(P)/FAD-dependent oxidoreductase [Muriicola sp. Z0-33]|uniref:NAD(P)/FAD-dependent oxidoreductase n=1 Tax=Muriicola sp. Z0-33 TaxID=2816957 RepID=UPI002238409C|nr:FAD-dependent oxidoreductase [Muriicola sp. Z0-33]MCW5514785.1 FAD-binding oxidoreductase [Muriicola sp. Z0-33]
MTLSYWEHKTWLSNIDYTIVGSGIVGLNCALRLSQRFPSARILVLEKGVLPQGASTKNAGFACFGSISEILSDLDNHTEEEVVELVKLRWEGIQMLRDALGDADIGYENHGGHEIFLKDETERYNHCLDNIGYINELLTPVFKQNAFKKTSNVFGFGNTKKLYISNIFEAQIDTGAMMAKLLAKARKQGVRILNATKVEEISETANGVHIKTDNFEFSTAKLFIATNGFASALIGEQVNPARAQVMVTKPIEHLKITGTFHMDEGYYYFRNVANRILLGGGRNLDFNTEKTTEFGLTERVQNKLEQLLEEVILPDIPFEIERRWSGIMGIGNQKKPVLKQYSDHVFCGVRLGGMGIAIGSYVGIQLADLLAD